jgi:N-acetylneuraminic acid mutarotase
MKKMGKMKFLLVASLLISIVFITTYAPSTKAAEYKLAWTTKASMPTPRAQAATVVGDDGKIYVMGGYNATRILNTTEVYDPSTNTWQTKAEMLTAVRCAAATKGPDGLIYVMSGLDGATYSAAVQAYNTTSDAWTSKSSIPYPVLFAAAVTDDNGKIYVIGGTETAGDTDRVQIYNTATDAWTSGIPLPAPRTQLGAVKDRDGFLYTLGGQTWPTTVALDAVEAYYPGSATWSTRPSMIEGMNEFGAVLGADDSIYVVGGGKQYLNNNPPFFGTVMVYSILTNSWGFDASMPTPRKELGAVSIGDSIYAIGGCNGTYLGVVEEAKIKMPNQTPSAYIDSVTPNPVTINESIMFVGHGIDPDGSIVGYRWRSSINGTLNTAAAFSITTLTNGTHSICFSVQDNSGVWSPEVTATVTVNGLLADDPLYQKLLDLNAAIGNLQNQNANLNSTASDLTNKVDMLAMELLGTSALIIILIVALIAVVFMNKRKSPPATPPAT